MTIYCFSKFRSNTTKIVETATHFVNQQFFCLKWPVSLQGCSYLILLVYVNNSLHFNFKQKSSDKPVKIDKWDGSALKNALDDAAKLVSFFIVICEFCIG